MTISLCRTTSRAAWTVVPRVAAGLVAAGALLALAGCTPAAGGDSGAVPSSTSAAPSSTAGPAASPAAAASPLPENALIRLTATWTAAGGARETAVLTLGRPNPGLQGAWTRVPGCAPGAPASPQYLGVSATSQPVGEWDGTRRLTVDAETLSPTTSWAPGAEPIQAECTSVILQPASRIDGVVPLSSLGDLAHLSLALGLEDPSAGALTSCRVDAAPEVPAAVVSRLRTPDPDDADRCGDVETS